MNGKGQATVEFALTVMVLLTLLFGIIDLSMMYYVNLTMQRAVREGTRYAVTGQKTGDAGRVELVKQIRDASNGLYDQNALLDKNPLTVSRLTPSETSKTFSNYTGYQGQPLTDTGGENDIIIVTLNYAWPLLTPIVSPFFENGRYTFTVRSTMRNEPWGTK